MNSRLPFLVEYAKTGRSKCKGCKDSVEKDSLRIAKMVPSSFHDGMMPLWFHSGCFFLKNLPTSVTEFENFDNIRWEDQESLKSQVESPPAPPETSKGKKSLKRPQSLRPDFSIELASSNRSKCVGCEAPIIKGFIRMGKLDTESKLGARYQGILRWYHPDCFSKLRESLNFFASGDTIAGFQDLPEESQLVISRQFPALDAPDGPSSSKKSKVSAPPSAALDPEEEQKIKEQTEKLFDLRDKLETLSKTHLKTLLNYNHLPLRKGDTQTLSMLSDALLFGVVKPCKKCFGPLELVSGVGYKCQGAFTEWTKCDLVTQDPERSEFQIPEKLKKKIPFLADWKPQVGRRILRVAAPPVASVPQTEVESPAPLINSRPMPLRGLQFVIAGKNSKDKEALTREIMLLGGQVVAKIHEHLAAVISDEETLKKGGKTFDTARKYDIQVVTEDLVVEVKDNKEPLVTLITKKNIASWGGDTTTRIANLIEESSSKGKRSSGKIKLKVKGGGSVDPDSGLQNVAHVYENGDEKYTVTLVQTDIQSNKNSFYKMQVLKHDVLPKFYLFRSWGRIGTDAGGKKLSEMSRESCTGTFKSLYREKTGNWWQSLVCPTVKRPGKMYPVDTADDTDDDEDQALLTASSSRLKQPVQDLIKLIFDLSLMRSVMKEYELDTTKMPLGKLSKKQLHKAYEVLNELQELLTSGCPDRLQLIDASNRFYTLVPHSFGSGEPTILDNEELIKTKCEMLNSLIDMEIAYSLVNLKTDGASQLESCYDALKTDIDVLDRESEEFKVIEEYARNTHSKIHTSYNLVIDNIFVVKRQGEEERYRPFRKVGNRKLLWHGSRTTNFAGILSQGLRIAPPEAPKTGYMFGKGIYFADMVSKSANYCCTHRQNPAGLLLLCDVALGNMYERLQGEYISELPSGKHSTLGVGGTHPDPTKVYKTEDGVQVPYGVGVNSEYHGKCCLLHNEYIIYNVGQVNIKYLIRFRFAY